MRKYSLPLRTPKKAPVRDIILLKKLYNRKNDDKSTAEEG